MYVNNETSDFIKTIFNPKKINISLRHYTQEVRWQILERGPMTRLGKIRFAQNLDTLASLCDGYNIQTNTIYFDKSVGVFEDIIDFYHSGKIHLQTENCANLIQKDMEYWGLDMYSIQPCCFFKFRKIVDDLEAEKEEMEHVKILQEITEKDNIFYEFLSDSRTVLWNFIEYPDSSIPAKIMSIISILFLVTSISSITLSTLSKFRVEHMKITQNGTIVYEFKDHEVFDYIEVISSIWFTCEILIRLFSTPDKLKYLQSFLNLIDIISIIPFYLTLTMNFLYEEEPTGDGYMALTVFKILRLSRILRIRHHFKSIKILILTFEHSADHFARVAGLLVITVILFAIPVYYSELTEQNRKITSIPDGIWFIFISITAVGYGDLVPVSLLGKVMSSMSCILGVLLISINIPLIAKKFDELYKMSSRRDAMNNFLFIQKTKHIRQRL